MVYKELFSDASDIEEETVNETTSVSKASIIREELNKELTFADEEAEHGTTVIPESVFKITEEESINMILPNYDVDYASNVPNDDGSLDDIKEELK